MLTEQTIPLKPTANPKLNVVLYWHMHQPEYRDLRNGQYSLPWTYLHTIKDYVDMVAHIEDNPDARAVVNFAPILLEQINDYSEHLDSYLHHGGALTDPMLAALADPVITANKETRIGLIKNCLRANEDRIIHRYPAFKTLKGMAKAILLDTKSIRYYDIQLLIDLLVWYHLAWIGETVKRKDQRVKELIKKERFYTIHDRRVLIELIHELMSGVIGRYKAMAEAGRIELSMTPFAHPIMPLLLDFNSASEAMPEAPLPEAKCYPGGHKRSAWHLKKGIETFEKNFGFKPAGCWPSEGSVSEETVKQCSEFGFRWLASGETVLRNSLHKSKLTDKGCIHTAYQLADTTTTCFFRDDQLSDRIGFKFSDWHADDAVGNLLETLQHIAQACQNHPAPIVSIILDGENAWEYYPENGYHFLTALYQRLASHPQLNLTTYSDYLDQNPEPRQLSNLAAGSWVYGSFSTWIGSSDKNRAWDMLVDAKKAFDSVIENNTLDKEEVKRAKKQLATCESSDWFWWFGDYNPAESVKAFDQQFRMHLCNLYHLLHHEAPEYLSHGFSSGSQSSQGGVMLPGKQD